MRTLARGKLNLMARQLFIDMNNCPGSLATLNDKSRKIASITALITSGEFEQLKCFFENCKKNSTINAADIEQAIIQITTYTGFAKAYTALRICKQVFRT